MSKKVQTAKPNRVREAFPDYEILSREVIVFRPDAAAGSEVAISEETTAAAARQSSSDGPTTIMLFSWGDAVPKHVAKYCDGYRALWPQARIIVVFSAMSEVMFNSVPWNGKMARSKAMKPAVEAALLGHGSLGVDGEQILVSVMSNTGAVTCVAMVGEYIQMRDAGTPGLPPGKPFPYKLWASDSTPGGVTFHKCVVGWSLAFAGVTGKWFPWPVFITQVMWFIVLCANQLRTRLLLRQTVGEFSVDSMVNEKYVPKDTLRLHIYSSADKVITHESIEENIARAASAGYKTRNLVFDDTQHVGHMRVHPEKYWSEIQSAWKEATA